MDLQFRSQHICKTFDNRLDLRENLHFGSCMKPVRHARCRRRCHPWFLRSNRQLRYHNPRNKLKTEKEKIK